MENEKKFMRKVRKEVQGLQNKLPNPLRMDLKSYPYHFYVEVEDGDRLALQVCEIGLKKESDYTFNKKQLDFLYLMPIILIRLDNYCKNFLLT